MGLKIYNTLSRKKEEFIPLHSGRVNIYVCGPTVYDHAHLGHAKTYVSFDVIVRYLKYLGYNVRYVQNITDVGHLTDDADEGEDKIAKRASQERLEPMELVETYMRSYFEDMDALNVQRPNISPRASGHIPEQIELVKTLIEKGFAYEVNGSVYFDVGKFPEYGKLSGRRAEDQKESGRIGFNPDKRSSVDFALWKRAERGHILRWPSPWGEGFPGWHVECSAMSMKYLGEAFDIHGGGLENVFPHHECEIAQSECATGKPFVRYWMHNGMLTINGTKMGKSLGNFITIKDMLRRYASETIRYFILTTSYRSPIDFSDKALTAADKGLKRIYATVERLREAVKGRDMVGSRKDDSDLRLKLGRYKDDFTEAMNDDFNTAGALSVLFDLSKEVNSLLDGSVEVSRNTLEEIDRLYSTLGGNILGIIPSEFRKDSAKASGLEDDLIKIIVSTRDDLRQMKQWELADKVRDGLAKLGIILEDRPDGTTWKSQLPQGKASAERYQGVHK